MHSKSGRIALVAIIRVTLDAARRAALFAVISMSLTAPVAHAQFDPTMATSTKPLHVWLGGGVSVPVSGNFKEAFDTGFNGRGMITYQPAGFPIGIRLDLSFQKFALSSVEVSGGGIPLGENASTQILSTLGNVVYTLPLGAFRPYISAGIGAFRIKTELDDPELDDAESEIQFGINGAAGFQFRLSKSLTLFAEGRLDNVYTDEGVIDEEDIQVVPVTFGIIF